VGRVETDLDHTTPGLTDDAAGSQGPARYQQQAKQNSHDLLQKQLTHFTRSGERLFFFATGLDWSRETAGDQQRPWGQAVDEPFAWTRRGVTGKDWMSTTLLERLGKVRRASVDFCSPLAVEDYGLQAMPETSPPKWHLAHTTWFFETFILENHAPGYRAQDTSFRVLFNSYYNGIGERHPRAERGLLSRPTLDEVMDYRHRVDAAMTGLLEDTSVDQAVIAPLVELGIQHEQQHQELFFTDIKYSLSRNPLSPAYLDDRAPPASTATPLEWLEHPGGEVLVGASGEGFSFDNELPPHRVLLEPYTLANRLVTNAEFREFMDDGGYRQPEHWLSDGWTTVEQQGWQQPLYWQWREDGWWEYTLYGLQPLDPEAPVSHLSGYEADAYARWAGARLPSEFEWEAVAAGTELQGQFLDDQWLHPIHDGRSYLYGSAWNWTSSAYSAYPNYRPERGAIGEYNGKFMANQLVLRGGSCVSSRDHLRASYRNFFYPPDRWQFTGVRLAKWL
jgi:ergothioneine biosynthesis protein EgtB